MIRQLKRACGIHFSTKALARNPGVHVRQAFRRFRSFRNLLDELADERRIAVVQIGANDGRDALGDLIRDRADRIKRALLIEPQQAAFERLVRHHEGRREVVCLNAAIDREPGERILYTIGRCADHRLGDGIASFDRRHVEKEIRAGTNVRSDSEVAALITEETVMVATIGGAAAAAGIEWPDVLLVDTEGYDGEIVRMVLEAGRLPSVIQYEHKHLTQSDRNYLSNALRRRGYRLWADQADVWGLRIGARPSGGRPLVLFKSEPFAKGGYRHCYVHPDNADLCVKAVARIEDPKCDTAQRHEIADCLWLKKHWSDALSERIPAFEGIVDTDRGVGIVMRLCRDSDGRISRDLAKIIQERGLAPPLVRAVDDLERWLRKHRLLTRDTAPKNVAAVHSGGDRWTLVIIEAWRHRRWHWLARLHPLFADWLIRRQMRKFRRRATSIAKVAVVGSDAPP